jgi:hypothetical protein
VQHNIALTRVLVAGHVWAAQHPNFRLAQTRICYELARTPATISLTNKGKAESLEVIPDAWLLFERTKGGEHEHGYPLLLEVDRGMEYREKFKRHVRSRLEFIKKGGAYSKLFGTEAVMIAYVTTGDRPEYRESRREAWVTIQWRFLLNCIRRPGRPSFVFAALYLTISTIRTFLRLQYGIGWTQTHPCHCLHQPRKAILIEVATPRGRQGC